MEFDQLPDEIRKVAMDFDNAIESKDIELMVSCFAEDCEIELLGLTLKGKDGVRRWIEWMYRHVDEVRIEPVIIMVDGNAFFEEFIVRAKLPDGSEAFSKQAEVLIYEDYRIKSLRLYFDRLDFADSVVRNTLEKAVVRWLIRLSTKGLQ